MCTPARRAGPYRTARRSVPRRAGGGGRRRRSVAARLGGRDPHDSTQPSPGADSTIRSPPASCARSRMPVTPKWRPRERSARSSGTSKPSPSSAIVSTARPPSIRSRTETADARAWRSALRSASRRIHSSSRAATASSSPTSSIARSSRTSCAAAQRSASALQRDRQRQRGLAALVGAQAGDDLARLARGLAGVVGQPPRLGRPRPSGRARSGARARARRSRCPRRSWPASRACRGRAASAPPRRPCGAPARRAAPRPPPGGRAAAARRRRRPRRSRTASGWPRSVWKFDGTGSTPARTEMTQ